MSKAVLMSIQPKWCELIVSGKKTVELRKTKPKIDIPFKVYIYQTKKPVAVSFSGTGRHIAEYDKTCWYNERSGKVIGEFVCDNILEIGFSPYNHGEYLCHDQTYIEQSCVPFEEMFDYLGEIYGYGWHISNLVIYDTPKELGEFITGGYQTYDYPPLVNVKRPPQSWCYVEGV